MSQNVCRIPCRKLKDDDMRLAVIGGGLAGVASAYHLVKASPKPIQLTLYEGSSLGAGASGAAAGLLHPYNGKGRLLWRGKEALDEAKQLVHAAEGASEGETGIWNRELMRPALTDKQNKDLLKPEVQHEDGIRNITHEEALALVPGLQLPSTCGGILLDGLVINVETYLKALWAAVVKAAEARSDGSEVRLILDRAVIESLKKLDPQMELDGIVVATGAAAGMIEEVKGSSIPSLLTLSLGYSLTLEPKEGAREQGMLYPSSSPCLLGQTYFSAQGDNITIGATQSKEGWTAEDSLAMCCATDGRIVGSEDIEERSVKTLMDSAECIWPPISKGYRIKRVRSGMRALAPRRKESKDFRMPIVQRISEDRNAWYAGGLGARGFLYHGLVGKAVAQLALGIEGNPWCVN